MTSEHIPVPMTGTVYSWCGLVSDGETVSDFPLHAVCSVPECHRPIVRARITEWWIHRDPDAPLPDSPADSSL